MGCSRAELRAMAESLGTIGTTFLLLQDSINGINALVSTERDELERRISSHQKIALWQWKDCSAAHTSDVTNTWGGGEKGTQEGENPQTSRLLDALLPAQTNDILATISLAKVHDGIEP